MGAAGSGRAPGADAGACAGPIHTGGEAMSPESRDLDATAPLAAVDPDIADPPLSDLQLADPPVVGEVLSGEIVVRDAVPATPAAEPAEALDDEDGDWLVSSALVPVRGPIASHRKTPGAPSIRFPLIMAAVVVVAGAIAWVAVGGLGRSSVPPVVLGTPPVIDAGSLPGPGTPASATTSVPQPPQPPAPAGRTSRPPTGSASPTTSGSGPSASDTTPATGPTTTGSTSSQPLTSLTATPPPVPVVNPGDGMVVRVVNQDSGQAMSVAGDSTNDGALIVQSPATSTVEQWRLVGVFGSCFALVNQFTGKALDDPQGSRDDGTQMQQWAYGVGDVNQMWCLRSVGKGQFSIQSIRSGQLLDLSDEGDAGVIQSNGSSSDPDTSQTWDLFAAA
jgi:hypothetical protein